MKLYVDSIHDQGQIGFTTSLSKVNRNLALLPLLQESVDSDVQAGIYQGIISAIGRWVIVYEPYSEKPHFIFVDVNNDLTFVKKNDLFSEEALKMIRDKQIEVKEEGYVDGVELIKDDPD